MAGFARGDFAGGDLTTQKQFFEAHLKPWALRFFTDLETVKRADFYRAVGLYGRLFFELKPKPLPCRRKTLTRLRREAVTNRPMRRRSLS